MANKLSGKVHLIEDAQSYGAKGFRKRTVVLVQERGTFSNYVPLEFVNDDCDVPANWDVGDEVTVEFALNGREYQGRYFVNVRPLKWTVESKAAAPAAAPATAKPAKEKEPLGGYGDDDAPF